MEGDFALKMGGGHHFFGKGERSGNFHIEGCGRIANGEGGLLTCHHGAIGSVDNG